jgi:hypothetical protein
MKYAIFFCTILGVTTIIAPAQAQFASFPSGSDNCSTICFKVDVGSANNDNSFFNSGFNNSSGSGSNNLRWQVGVTWRPNAPEVAQAEGERTKQRLEDNRSLMTTLAEAIAQNRTALARGIAILLAPRLGYNDPRKLIAEMKEGSLNLGVMPVAPTSGTPNLNLAPSIAPAKVDPTVDSTSIIELR